jgi:hypothetical protein
MDFSRSSNYTSQNIINPCKLLSWKKVTYMLCIFKILPRVGLWMFMIKLLNVWSCPLNQLHNKPTIMEVDTFEF